MRHKTHKKSWVSIVAEHVHSWRYANKWSLETAAEVIVEKYHEIYPNGLPGIDEFSTASDVFNRNRVNATRIFRWLDDINKDTNFLGANFMPVILQAMPESTRIHCLNELMRQMDIVAEPTNAQFDAVDPIHILKVLIKESAEACDALTDLIDGETKEELINAQQQLIELGEIARKELIAVNAKLAAIANAGN